MGWFITNQMNTLSHALSGVIVLRVLTFLLPEQYSMSTSLIVMSLVFAYLSDIDIFFAKTVKDHHKTPFHAPLFWILVSAISLFFMHWSIALLLLLCVLVHALLDYMAARTTGIMFFFPFSIKEYSLFPIKKAIGNFHPWKADKKSYQNYLKNYMKNVPMVIVEVLVFVFGVLAFFY